MELPQAKPSRCLQAHLVSVTVDVGRMHQPADRELLLTGRAAFLFRGNVLKWRLEFLSPTAIDVAGFFGWDRNIGHGV
jgi:hypothetical protein